MSAPGPGRLRETVGPAAVAAVLVAALVVSWDRWPDVLIDFGKDVYFAWRITEGEVLYRDLAHFLGPLSPYLNALWLRLLGPGLHTIFAANLALLVLSVALAYGLLRYAAGAVAATAGAVAFVLAGAAAHVVAIGGYNFVAPNTHENTHSFLLAMLALACFAFHAHRGGRAALLLAGVSLGLAVLTRPAPAVAVGLALAAGVAARCWMRPGGGRDLAPSTLAVAAGVAIPVAAAVALLALAMPVADAVRGALAPWLVAFDGDVRGLPTHRAGMGLDRIPDRLRAVGLGAAVFGLYFGGLYLLASRLRPPPRHAPVVLCLVLTGLAAILGQGLRTPAGTLAWVEAAQPLQVVLLATLGGLAAAIVRARGSGAGSPRLAVSVALAVFGLASLLKMILNVRIYQYGYVLATPGLLVFAAAVTGWLPARLRRRGGWGGLFAAGSLAALAVWLAAIQTVSLDRYEAKVYPVGEGPDRFLADARGRLVAAALADLEARAGPGRTLAVLPEGALLNFLVRRANPTPYTNLMPVELVLFGESEIEAAYRGRPPDFVVLAHKDTSEFGARFFGTDYGRGLGRWLARHYRTVAVYGAHPLRDDRFGLALLERIAGPAGPPDGALKSAPGGD